MVLVKPASERRTQRKITDDVRDDIIRMYNDDYRILDIASKYDISKASVYRVIRETRRAQSGQQQN